MVYGITYKSLAKRHDCSGWWISSICLHPRSITELHSILPWSTSKPEWVDAEHKHHFDANKFSWTLIHDWLRTLVLLIGCHLKIQDLISIYLFLSILNSLFLCHCCFCTKIPLLMIPTGLASSLPNTRNMIHSPKRESGSHSSQPSPTHQPRWKDVLSGSDSKDNKIKPPAPLQGHRVSTDSYYFMITCRW